MGGAWVLVFPLVVHAAVLAGAVGFAASVIVAYVLVQVGALRRLRVAVRVALGGALCLAFALVTLLGSADWVVFVLPMLVYGVLLKLFADSLRRGSEPIATRFARFMEDEPLGERQLEYTRSVTRFWVAYFLLMLALSALLAVFAPLWLWSWFANVAGYVLTALLFVAEFMVRRRVLGGQAHGSVRAYFMKLAKCDFRLMTRR